MALSRPDVVELVHDQLLPALTAEQHRLAQIDLWYRWQHEDVTIPRVATPELRSLLQLAKTPWLGLVVTNVAQSLYIDGYRSPDRADNSAPWRLWQANDLDGRQSAIHRAALAYGQAFGVALPGVDDFGDSTAVMRGVSPRKMLAFYADPAEDDWPVYALRADGDSLRLYDDEVVHHLGYETDAAGRRKLVYIEDRGHGIGVCPVVRFTNLLDLDGR
nr:phage portal protein [Actinomycetota bacterium]